jgi:hypothetical protein
LAYSQEFTSDKATAIISKLLMETITKPMELAKAFTNSAAC